MVRVAVERPTYRYVIVRFLDVDASILEDKLVAAVMEFGGIKGLSEVEPSVVHVDPKKGIAVIRVKREGLHLFRAALAAYEVPLVGVIKVTGTLRKAKAISSSLSF
jgi:RNase P/RNase MRP subunit POP5